MRSFLTTTVAIWIGAAGAAPLAAQDLDVSELLGDEALVGGDEPLDPVLPGGAPIVDDAPAPARVPVALPTGTEQNAARPEVLSLPTAEGSLRGMGESFSM